MPDDVGVALADGVGDVVGVGVGESLADGDALALGVGVGLVAEAAVQPVRTITIALVAPSRAMREAMVVQRRKGLRRAHQQPPPAWKRRRDDLL
jgi:hypothetical protein